MSRSGWQGNNQKKGFADGGGVDLSGPTYADNSIGPGGYWKAQSLADRAVDYKDADTLNSTRGDTVAAAPEAATASPGDYPAPSHDDRGESAPASSASFNPSNPGGPSAPKSAAASSATSAAPKSAVKTASVAAPRRSTNPMVTSGSNEDANDRLSKFKAVTSAAKSHGASVGATVRDTYTGKDNPDTSNMSIVDVIRKLGGK